MKLIVARDAVADIDRLRAFLADKNPAAAQRAVTTIVAAIQSLDMSPDRGRPTGTVGVRELIVPFGRSAYVPRYSHLPDADEVLIFASGTAGSTAIDGAAREHQFRGNAHCGKLAPMSEHLRPAPFPASTQAAEGLPRRRWSVAEIQEMVAKGIILEDERFEMIGGEVVPMSPKGNRHEVVKTALQQYWFPRIVGSPINLITETTLYVAKDEFYEPDFLFWPRSIALKDVTAATALLIVEVADTSLRYDLGTKADIYSGLELCELWVINAETLVTTTHRAPQLTRYANVENKQPHERIEPIRAPSLAVTLGTLDLD